MFRNIVYMMYLVFQFTKFGHKITLLFWHTQIFLHFFSTKWKKTSSA